MNFWKRSYRRFISKPHPKWRKTRDWALGCAAAGLLALTTIQTAEGGDFDAPAIISQAIGILTVGFALLGFVAHMTLPAETPQCPPPPSE